MITNPVDLFENGFSDIKSINVVKRTTRKWFSRQPIHISNLNYPLFQSMQPTSNP
jgi:hypothetical protein